MGAATAATALRGAGWAASEATAGAAEGGAATTLTGAAGIGASALADVACGGGGPGNCTRAGAEGAILSKVIPGTMAPAAADPPVPGAWPAGEIGMLRTRRGALGSSLARSSPAGALRASLLVEPIEQLLVGVGKLFAAGQRRLHLVRSRVGDLDHGGACRGGNKRLVGVGHGATKADGADQGPGNHQPAPPPPGLLLFIAHPLVLAVGIGVAVFAGTAVVMPERTVRWLERRSLGLCIAARIAACRQIAAKIIMAGIAEVLAIPLRRLRLPRWRLQAIERQGLADRLDGVAGMAIGFHGLRKIVTLTVLLRCARRGVWRIALLERICTLRWRPGGLTARVLIQIRC